MPLYFAGGDLVTFQRGLDEMGEIMKPRASHMFVIPGNHETEGDIAALCSKFGFTNFHEAIRDPAEHKSQV